MDLHEAVVLSLLTGLSRRRLAERFRRAAHSALQPGSIVDRSFQHQSFEDVFGATARRPLTGNCLERVRCSAAEALDRARRSQIVPVVLGSSDYPIALETIFDPPVVLWCRGRLEVFGCPAVAIVGARSATAYARAVARHLGTDLAERGVSVVSGLARGVDVAAHEGALESRAELATVAVLGSGVDVIYPAEHAQVADLMVTRGAIVSEFPPGTRPRPEHFPRRNRIISGLSRAVVVVEASQRSGALITADYALDQGRDLFAVPGNVLTGRNGGAHGLLREGAKIAETADDILDELGVQPSTAQSGTSKSGDGCRSLRDPVLRCMEQGETYELDDLARESGLTPTVLLPRLLELELAGRVRREGAQFVLSASAR